MISLLVSLVGTAVTRFAPWIASPLGRAGVIFLASLALYSLGYWRGHTSAETGAELATLRAQVETYKRDKEAADKALQRAEAEAAANAQIAAINAKIVEEFRNAPKTDGCRLTRDDVRRLQQIR